MEASRPSLFCLGESRNNYGQHNLAGKIRHSQDRSTEPAESSGSVQFRCYMVRVCIEYSLYAQRMQLELYIIASVGFF